MSTLHVHLFGRFRVQRDDSVLDGFDNGKARELFCYLLLHRQRPHQREVLVGTLWGNHPTSQAKKWLRQVLWQLQSSLDASTSHHPPLLLLDKDWIQVNPEADLWLDVDVFEQAFSSLSASEGRLDSQQSQALRDAVELYQDDLLTGMYHDWCIYHRERLQNMFLAMLDKLMDEALLHHEYRLGVTYGERILGYDRARERTHRCLMQLHYLADGPAAALRQYARCVLALREELDVAPGQKTQRLVEDIRQGMSPQPGPRPLPATPPHSLTRKAGHKPHAPVSAPLNLPPARPPSPALASPASVPVSPVRLLRRLKRYHALLTAMQRTLKQDIHALEDLLRLE